MRSLSSVGLGLSLVFGFLLLALVAELYYLLWWKKRVNGGRREVEDDDYRSPGREFLYMFCRKTPCSNSQEICSDSHVHEPQAQTHNNGGDFCLKPFGEEEEDGDDLDVELMRMQGLPRFLFTIKEETKEDLESLEDDGRWSRRRSRSLSDVILKVETPFLTPLASPPYFTPPLTPPSQGFNPLFESANGLEFSRMMMRSPSPPPKFKFLRDAEEKLCRRKTMEEETEEFGKKKNSNGSMFQEDEENGSFITLIIAKNKASSTAATSSSSQVLPLASSPSTFKPPSDNKRTHLT